ncbi:holo-ACP synthase [Pseudochryseolinea flava]|uniref:Holo-[acyl-carrier-protein] synthase n=1 Tax=Pseudochryseolinea flava TaxID=2059302 RepID=A0A364Y0N4_9BACT|nr:holo-ACP synthase [Pseudochryseolinea flava]RAW00158.1 holo-[acyl-carrier-protein] synthase [Pseudochryseolinea flava]
MIVGNGIDMVEVKRIADKIARDTGFREVVFSTAEINYCEKALKKAEHYAARFAAKEAFLKASGLGLTAGHELHLIEVASDSLGKPSIVLGGKFKQLAEENGWNKIHVSLTHVAAFAMAFVIIER